MVSLDVRFASVSLDSGSSLALPSPAAPTAVSLDSGSSLALPSPAAPTAVSGWVL